MIDYGEILSGSRCEDVFLQPTAGIMFPTDTFVVNFVKRGVFFSFHSFAMVRLLYHEKVVYTVTDHYLNDSGTAWRRGQRKLSTHTFKSMKQIILKHEISRFSNKNCGDVIIEFDNGALLEFIVDVSPSRGDPEMHRLIIKKDIDSVEGEHYVFKI